MSAQNIHFGRGVRMSRPITSQRAQGGIILIVALVLLLAMTLAGALLLRSVGAGVGVAGNLGFKQNATSAADRGIEAARAWLTADARVASDFETDKTDQGYFAKWKADSGPEFNPLTYNWADGEKARALPRDDNGNQVSYVIHRLCSDYGPISAGAQKCVMPRANISQEGAKCVTDPSECFDASQKRPYFRITARVDGPRNTFSYVQVVMF